MASNLYPQLALVTDAIAANLENTLVSAKSVQWKDKSQTKITPTNGFQVVERVSPNFNIRKTTGTVSNLTAGKQDTVFGAEIYRLNDIVTLDFAYEDFAHIRDEDQAARDDRLMSIGRNAGELVDADITRTLGLGGNNATGTPGNAVDDIEALLDGYVRAKEEGVPDMDMMACLSYRDLPALSKYLVETVTSNTGTQEAILGRMGPTSRLKNLVGMPIMFTQQLPTLTTGTRTNGAVNGAGQSSNYRTVSQSIVTNGNFLTQTLQIDGLGANATIRDGEIFEIEGVIAWDNRKQASQNRPVQFRVIGDTTATAGGAATVRIFPAIVVADNSSPIGDVGVNNAHATVNSAPADNAVVTFRGAPSTEYIERFISSKYALCVYSADLEDLPSGENARRKMMSVPLTLRAHRYSEGDTGTTSVRFDTPYEANFHPYGRFKTIRING